MLESKNVCVVMGDDRPVVTGRLAMSSYPSLAYEINRRFCEKLGWDFRYEQYQLPKYWWGKLPPYSSAAHQSRAASWVKLLAVQRALDLGYEFVVWIDSDCIFYDHHADWSSTLSHFNQPEVSFLSWVDRPFYTDQFCAGFFIVRSSDRIRELIRTTWTAPSTFSLKHVYEQSELNAAIKDWPSSHYVIVDEPMFELEDDTQKLLHIASFNHKQRVPSFLKWFADRGLKPEPQKTLVHVITDLEVDEWDRRWSGVGLSGGDFIRRYAQGIFQTARAKLKRLKSLR
ncbi:MAG: hypothetical protein ACO22D_03520 [Schleiferiaceae bacterium]